MGDGHLEREAKLGAWPGFALPDLSSAVPDIEVREEEPLDLDAVYVDTEDLALVRRNVSLRRRTGEGRPRWTLKLPQPSSGATLSRREFDVEDPSEELPASLATLLTAWIRRRPVVPVAHIHTLRHRLAVEGADGAALAEIDDDEVSVLDGDHVAARFREIEIELVDGSEDLLEVLVDALVRAGAGAPDPTSKVVRALGPRALAPPELDPADVDADATVAEVVVAGFTRSAAQIVDHDHVIRLDDDVEGVHKARVGTRRMRSDLATLAPLLDEAWTTSLRDELKWLAASLGAVRDTDVLLERLWRGVEGLPEEDRPAAAAVVEKLERERRTRLADLLVDLGTDRYLDLLDRVVGAATDPPLVAKASKPAERVLPGLVAPRWGKLVKAVARLGPRPTDDELHRVRILTKRVRYASDVAVPVVGKPAARLSEALADLQDVLGDLHDTAVAVEWLRGASTSLTRAQALAAGQLIAAQRQEAEELRRSWRGAWDACDRAKLTGWLR